MAITGGYVNVNGIKTYYETNNGPHNPKGTIIALHTAGRETRQYHGMMEYWENKYTVIAFDLPAHGKSWPLPGNVGIKTSKDYGKFVWDFIQAMGVTDPIESTPGSIRGDFALDKGENVIHGSDSPEAAEREIKNFFKPEEIY